MKDLLKNGWLIVLVLLVLYLLVLRECKPRIETREVTKEIVIRDTTYITIAKPIRVEVPVPDPVYIRDTVVIQKPVKVDEDLLMYATSTVNDSIRVWDSVYVYGTIDRWWRVYEPVIFTREVEKLQTQVKNKSHLYLSGQVGGNMDMFVPGASLDFVTKKGNLYGVQGQYINNSFVPSFRMGFRIF